MFPQHHNLGSPELLLSSDSCCCSEPPVLPPISEQQVQDDQFPKQNFSNNDFKVQSPTLLPPALSAEQDEERLMNMVPQEAVVTYGPYYVMGILDYREERLSGLQCALRYIGACPRFERGNRINHVSIKYLDREIFRCKLTDLRHGGDGGLDELCFEAAKALRDEMNCILDIVRDRYGQKSQLKPWEGSATVFDDSNAQDNNKARREDRCSKLLEPLKQVRMPRIRMGGKPKATRTTEASPQHVQETKK